MPSSYPGALPPPVEYAKPPRKRRVALIGLGALVIVMVAAVAATIVFAQRGTSSAATTLNPESARAAIQDYLDALTQGRDERVAEHSSCGLFDAVKDKRTDMALANLASETFRRQFSSVEVSSVDKIVELSSNQAQVLFSMNAKSAGRSTQNDAERQAVAQLLVQDDQILVCSYLPRGAGQF